MTLVVLTDDGTVPSGLAHVSPEANLALVIEPSIDGAMARCVSAPRPVAVAAVGSRALAELLARFGAGQHDLPVIAVTERATTRDVVAAVLAGADDVVDGATTPARLRDAVADPAARPPPALVRPEVCTASCAGTAVELAARIARALGDRARVDVVALAPPLAVTFSAGATATIPAPVVADHGASGLLTVTRLAGRAQASWMHCTAGDDGPPRWLIHEAYRITSHDLAACAIVVTTDVSAVRHAIRHYQELDDLDLGLIALDCDERFVWWSPAVERATGLGRDDVLGRTSRDLFPELHTEERARQLRLALAGQRVELAEALMSRGDRGALRYRATLGPIRASGVSRPPGAGDQIVGARVVIEWTERLHALETTVAGLERSVSDVLAELPEGVVVHRNDHVLMVNRTFAAWVGRDADELRGRSLLEFLRPADHAVLRERTHALASGSALMPREYHLIDRAGGSVVVESNGVRVLWDGGPAIVTISRNVSERRRLDDLRRSETGVLVAIAGDAPLPDALAAQCQALERLWPGAHALIAVDIGGSDVVAAPSLDAAQRVAVRAAIGDLGRLRQRPCIVAESLGDPLGDLWVAPVRALSGGLVGVVAVTLTSRRLGEPGEADLLERAATVVALAADRHAAHAALAASQRRYRDLVENVRDVVYQVDGAGVITFLSSRWRELTGWPAADAIGRALVDFVHPDDRGGLATAIGQPALGHVVRIRRDDGEQVWVEARARALPDGGSAGTLSDVSERRQLESHLMMTDRMASMGLLAAGVAHEINNPLASLMANLELVGRDLDQATEFALPGSALAELPEILVDARDAAGRIRDIVRDLRLLSRPEDTSDHAVALPKVLDSTLRMAGNHIRHRARLTRAYAEVPMVRGGEARLGQLFLNLIVNAAQAIPDGDAEHHELAVITRTDERGGAVVEIRDTGCGMSPEIQRRIFDAFFTTKPIGEGTGLGLSICHRIVTSLGGRIEVDSTVGVGSTFRVLLPAADRVAPLRRRQVSTRPPARRARVLAVDDEQSLGRAIQRTLGRDHDIVFVASADEALRRMLDEHFDVVLCDLMMPERSGMELYEEIERVRPDLARRFVFMTGGDFTPRAREFLGRVPCPRLDKPFDVHALRGIVADRLR